MARRLIDIDGTRWEVTSAGSVTQYVKDEFALVFTRSAPGAAAPERRIVRYSPTLRHRELSLNGLTDEDLQHLFRHSQPSWTSPELGYRR